MEERGSESEVGAGETGAAARTRVLRCMEDNVSNSSGSAQSNNAVEQQICKNMMADQDSVKAVHGCESDVDLCAKVRHCRTVLNLTAASHRTSGFARRTKRLSHQNCSFKRSMGPNGANCLTGETGVAVHAGTASMVTGYTNITLTAAMHTSGHRNAVADRCTAATFAVTI